MGVDDALADLTFSYTSIRQGALVIAYVTADITAYITACTTAYFSVYITPCITAYIAACLTSGSIAYITADIAVYVTANMAASTTQGSRLSRDGCISYSSQYSCVVRTILIRSCASCNSFVPCTIVPQHLYFLLYNSSTIVVCCTIVVLHTS